MIALNLTGTPTAALRMFDRYNVFVAQRVVTGIVKLVGVCLALAVDGGALWVLGGWILGEFLGWLIVMFQGWAELRRRGLGDFMRSDVRHIETRHPGVWRFAIITNISLAIRMGSKEVNDVVIGVVLSEYALGLFRVAKQFSVIIGMVHDALAQPLYPDMSRYAASRQWSKLKEAFMGGLKIATIVVVPAWLGLAVFGHWLIYFTAGAEFIDAHLVMVLYAFGVSISSIFHGLAGLPMALNRPTVPLKAMLMATLVQYAVLFALVGQLELTAAGIAVVAHSATWAVISAWFVRDVPALLRNQP
jgi:O-antigen/teichoic acid export membrane protein